MNTAKERIKQIVKDYKTMFPREYSIVVEQIKKKKGMVKNEFSEVEDSSNEMRALYEIPETLSTMLTMNLNEEQLVWLKMGGKGGHEGGRWFAREFGEFALPRLI